MDNVIYIIFVSVFVPLILMMVLTERRARLPILFFMIGIFASVFISELNGVLYSLFALPINEFVVKVSPISEEIIKALPILFFASMVSDKRETLLTVAMATGIGFAVLENAYILVENQDSFSMLSAVIRGFGTGLMHGMCTFFVGYGISFVKKKKKLFVVGVFALLSLAITYHSIFNMLIQSDLIVVGALFPIATYMPFFIKFNFLRKKRRRDQKAAVAAATMENANEAK